jgi:hypothetical protein
VVVGAVVLAGPAAAVVGAWEVEEGVVPIPWNKLGAGWLEVTAAEEVPGPDVELVLGLNWNKPLVVVAAVAGACDAVGVPIPKSDFAALVSATVDAGAGVLEDIVFGPGKEKAGLGAVDSVDAEPGIEKGEDAGWLDVCRLPNSGGADVDGVEVVEVWPRLKRGFGAPGAPTGAVGGSFEASGGLLKP